MDILSMEDYAPEEILKNRIFKINQVFNQFDIKNFAISYSGGKDSNVLSELIDLAVPGNHIPRVFMHTGIELNAVVDFVKQKQKEDYRIHIIRPQKNIKSVLEEYGYPFKSKEHSSKVFEYKRLGMREWIREYADGDFGGRISCPKILRYQFTDECKLKISDKCCKELKEKPLKNWQNKTGFKFPIIGIRRSEGGRRANAICTVFSNGKLKAFQPLAPVDEKWIDWMVINYEIELPIVYYPPYNFSRTGCKGCPFAINLQAELDTLEKYFPKERKQCEAIWKPVYDEYRRIGYRLCK